MIPRGRAISAARMAATAHRTATHASVSRMSRDIRPGPIIVSYAATIHTVQGVPSVRIPRAIPIRRVCTWVSGMRTSRLVSRGDGDIRTHV